MVKSITDPDSSSLVPSEISQRSPEDVCEHFDPSKTMDFTPAIPPRATGNLRRAKSHLVPFSDSSIEILRNIFGDSLNSLDVVEDEELSGLNFLP